MKMAVVFRLWRFAIFSLHVDPVNTGSSRQADLPRANVLYGQDNQGLLAHGITGVFKRDAGRDQGRLAAC
jgi:hypothetical protein